MISAMRVSAGGKQAIPLDEELAVASRAENRGTLEACKAGDRMALERLFLSLAPRVYRWAVLLGLSAEDAEDAAQESLAIAARQIEHCAAEAALSSWLFQITRRVAANSRRSAWIRRVFRSASGADDEPAFERASCQDAEHEVAVRRCFRLLSRPQAEVLLLADVEGYTRLEIAGMLGVPEGTVASRLRLAREAFKLHWEAHSSISSEGGES
jgi:RNA polymerase sigma-70 factor, ECF subfamily